MNLKKMYNITIYGMIALLVCTMSMMIYFNMLVSRSENVNKNRTELITLSNETLHNNNYLVKLMRLFIVSNDPAIREEYTNILMDESNLNGKLDRMAEIGLTSSEQTYVDEMWLLLDKLAAIEDSAFAAFDGGDTAAAANIIHSDEYTQADAKLAEHTENLIEEISNRTGSEIENIQTQTEITLLVISIIIFAAICSFIAIQIKQKDRVLNPIRDIQAIINRVAKGETNIRVRKKYYDEIGVMYDHINEMIKSITEQSQIIEKVAAGDLTVDIVPKSENDTMGFALKRMLDDLNRTFGEISSNTSHVSSGSSHIAVVAKNLTECVSEQVMAIDELSGAVSQITEQIKENTAMAEKATELAGMIKEDAEKGSAQMDSMMQAVREINDASVQIKKVIKVIDDIAFQTNILALNAAVEAARAGEAGKGFAVVAEEVRNLASKSAEAAQDTGMLIANSMEKAVLGARIAEETAESLSGIVAGIGESSRIVGEIARSSEIQNISISNINNGITHVVDLVQKNNSSSEESAATSIEMSSQAETLELLVSQFKLNK